MITAGVDIGAGTTKAVLMDDTGKRIEVEDGSVVPA